jgi:uncharacterized protein (DUF2062 family)
MHANSGAAMPRKHFRKFLPTHKSVLDNRYIAVFGSALLHHNLWHLHRRSVAGGVAVGMFCGLIPGPFQMLGAAICAILFHVNLPVALATTLYTNPFTIVPLYVVAYWLGSLATGTSGSTAIGDAPDFSFVHFADSIERLAAWTLSLGKPLAVGLVLLASLLAAAGYFAVRGAWRLYVIHAWRQRAQRRHDR